MTKKKDTIAAIVLLAAAFALVAVFDKVLPATGIIMTVLKKGCIYSLVAVSMNRSGQVLLPRVLLPRFLHG